MRVADNVKKVGEFVTYIGIACAFVMLVVGTVAIDIVILAALLKNSRENRNNGFDSFVTGMLFGMMFSSNNNRGLYSNAVISLLLSPITTGIAIALSFFLGVPAVGIGLALGWAGVAVSIGFGLMIHRVGELIEGHDANVVTVEHSTGATTYSYLAGYGMRPGASPATAPAAVYDHEGLTSVDDYSSYPQDPPYAQQGDLAYTQQSDPAYWADDSAFCTNTPAFSSPPTYDEAVKRDAPRTISADEYRGRFYQQSTTVYPSAPPPPVGQYSPQYQPPY